MYLSRLILSPTDAQARRDLADAYDMHRTLSRVYAEDEASPVERFLWRQEVSASGEHTVLVQAPGPGRWSVLTQRPGYLLGAQTDKAVNEAELLTTGRTLRFRLHANPTVTRDGKRHGLHREEEQIAWLHRQGARLGFDVQGVVRSSSARLTAQRKGASIRVQAVQFDGVLTVRDPAMVREAVLAGVGHAKSLGLGLLSVAPLR